MNKFIYIAFSLFLVFSCSNGEECKECEADDKINDSVPKKDTVSLENALKEEKTETVSVEAKENHEKIIKKFGEQWDFCACVVANDSINTAFEKSVSDKQAEKLMARWEYVEKKCKEFLTQPNSTPEERAAHEKKVSKCLKNK